MWTSVKNFFPPEKEPSEKEQYVRLKEKNPEVAFAEKALTNGEFEKFVNILLKFMEKNFPNKGAERQRVGITILNQAAEIATICLKKLIARGEMIQALNLIRTFADSSIGVNPDPIRKAIKDLQPEIKEVIKKYFVDIRPDCIRGWEGDISNAFRDITAVLMIQEDFGIPNSFLEDPDVYKLACQKVAGEVNLYFWYKTENSVAVFRRTGIQGMRSKKIPDIPKKILSSPEVEAAVEKRLKQYLDESDIENAKAFASVFHYEHLNDLIAKM